MRKPNGYGTVYKLSGNRRKPWVAAVTTEYYLTLDGKRVSAGDIEPSERTRAKTHRSRQAVGYFPTRKEAELALAKYNSDPYELGWTFEDVYEKWIATKTISNSSISGYERAYRRFAPIKDKKFADLRVSDLESVINTADGSQRSKVMMKLLLNQMYQYALKYDVVQHNLSERFTIEQPKVQIKREAFTDEEIAKLWKSRNEQSDIALIMIYTGVRIGELLTMEIDKDEWVLRGGSKTDAGRDRIVPIREKIRPLMDYDRDMSYNAFYQRSLHFLKKMGHSPHDCRVTFATRYKGCDETAIKLILGHKIDDITKGVYTKYTVDELREIVESVDY